MKIGLISDTHGSAKNFQKALDGPFKDVELILHAGDVFYHGPRSLLTGGYGTIELAEKINALKTPIMIARGNCDSHIDEGTLNTPLMSPYLFVYVDGKRIIVVHGDRQKEADLEELVRRFRLALLIHGHSHVARIKRAGESLIVNPGTPTIPNPSSPFKKTVAVVDTTEGKVRVLDIETDRVVLEGSFRP